MGLRLKAGNRNTRHDVFEVAPGQSYHVLVTQFIKAKEELYPLAYAGAWTFHSRVDCYEPNNTVDEAKIIPFNKMIEAYGIAGYKKYYIRNRDPETLDWYRFELTENTNVSIELLQVASNQQMNMRLLNNDRKVVFSVSAKKGELLSHKAGMLTPGTYYLEMHPIPDSRKANLLLGQSIPDHFDTPYRFMVKTNNDDVEAIPEESDKMESPPSIANKETKVLLIIDEKTNAISNIELFEEIKVTYYEKEILKKYPNSKF